MIKLCEKCSGELSKIYFRDVEVKKSEVRIKSEKP